MSKISTDSERYAKEVSKSFRNDVLYLIILPTEQCNFRCTYCYEDYAIGRMSLQTVQAVKALISRRIDGLKQLFVSWFGGEPLLARSVICEISEHIINLTKHRADFRYISDVTTNGYLLNDTLAEQLARLGIIRYQISLDGPEELHNQTRVRSGGKGSFQQIWENLLSIRDCAVSTEILIRVHLTSANISSMREFVVRVRDTFLHDSRFKVLLRPVERLGGPNDASFPFLAKSSQSKIISELQELISGGDSGEAVYVPTDICYASRANSLVIRADGSLAKCTVALRDERNSIGHILPDGTLDIRDERLRLWFHGWQAEKWTDLECPYGSLGRLPEDKSAALPVIPHSTTSQPSLVSAYV